MKDAAYELSITHLNIEDEKDFWADQKQFEVLLKQKDPLGYQSYLAGKHEVYRQHHIHCGERCDHSDQLTMQATFYLSNGGSVGNSEIVFDPKSSKIKE